MFCRKYVELTVSSKSPTLFAHTPDNRFLPVQRVFVAAVDEGSGIVTVKFDTNGVRKLAAAYAPLKVITEE